MLKKPTRDMLRKKGLKGIKEEHSNPTEFWSRIKEESLEAIRDLTLVSDIATPETRREIFNHQTLSPLIASITKFKGEELPDMNLIMRLIRSNMNIVIKAYSQANKYSPHLSKLTIEHLQRSIDICSDIAEIIYNAELETKAKKINLRYLFRSNLNFITDEKRFLDFVYYLIEKSKNDYLTSFINSGMTCLRYTLLNIRQRKLTLDIYDPDPDSYENIGTVNLIIDPANLKAHINIIIGGEEKINQSLKMEYDGGNKQYYYFTRK